MPMRGKNKKSSVNFGELTRYEILKKKKLSNGEYINQVLIGYKDAIKGLRKLRTDFDDIDLRKPLSPYQIRKTRKALVEYAELLNRPYTEIIKPKAWNRKALLNLGQQSDAWKIAYIPKVYPEQEIHYFKMGGKYIAALATENLITFNVMFNKKNFVKSPRKEIKRVLKGLEFDAIFVLTGKYELGFSFKSVGELIKECERLLYGYSNSMEWLHGLKITIFRNQASLKDYGKRKIRNKIENKKKLKKEAKKRGKKK